MSDVSQFCPQCGVSNPPDSRFCKACGAALASDAAPPAPAEAPRSRPHAIPPGAYVPTSKGRVGSPPAPSRSRPVPITPGLAPLPDVTPRSKRPRWKTALIVVGAVLGGLFVLGLIGQAVNPTPPQASPPRAGVVGATVTVDPSLAQGQAPPTDTTRPSDTPQPTAAPTATDTPPPADTPTQTAAQWALDASSDTYADVNDHPDLHQGDKVHWRCTINKFLGADPNDSTATDATCQMDPSAVSGTGSGEIALVVPGGIDTSSMHAGDSVDVEGTVGQPFQGTNGFNATITEPSITVVNLTDRTNRSGA